MKKELLHDFSLVIRLPDQPAKPPNTELLI